MVSDRLLYLALLRYKLFVPYLYRNIYNKLIYRHLHFLYRKVICSPTCFSLLCLPVSFSLEIVFLFLFDCLRSVSYQDWIPGQISLKAKVINSRCLIVESFVHAETGFLLIKRGETTNLMHRTIFCTKNKTNLQKISVYRQRETMSAWPVTTFLRRKTTSDRLVTTFLRRKTTSDRLVPTFTRKKGTSNRPVPTFSGGKGTFEQLVPAFLLRKDTSVRPVPVFSRRKGTFEQLVPAFLQSGRSFFNDFNYFGLKGSRCSTDGLLISDSFIHGY